jgi:hypothetical protein
MFVTWIAFSIQNQMEKQRELDERILCIGIQITPMARKQVETDMIQEIAKYLC